MQAAKTLHCILKTAISTWKTHDLIFTCAHVSNPNGDLLRTRGRFPSLWCPSALKRMPWLDVTACVRVLFFHVCTSAVADEGLRRSTRLDRRLVRNVKGLDRHQCSSGSIVLLTPDYQQNTCHVSPSSASQHPLTLPLQTRGSPTCSDSRQGWGRDTQTHTHTELHAIPVIWNSNQSWSN